MNVGRSVTIVKKPQSCPICAATRAQTGVEPNMFNQGILISFLSIAFAPEKKRKLINYNIILVTRGNNFRLQ